MGNFTGRKITISEIRASGDKHYLRGPHRRKEEHSCHGLYWICWCQHHVATMPASKWQCWLEQTIMGLELQLVTWEGSCAGCCFQFLGLECWCFLMGGLQGDGWFLLLLLLHFAELFCTQAKVIVHWVTSSKTLYLNSISTQRGFCVTFPPIGLGREGGLWEWAVLIQDNGACPGIVELAKEEESWIRTKKSGNNEKCSGKGNAEETWEDSNTKCLPGQKSSP